MFTHSEYLESFIGLIERYIFLRNYSAWALGKSEWSAKLFVCTLTFILIKRETFGMRKNRFHEGHTGRASLQAEYTTGHRVQTNPAAIW